MTSASSAATNAAVAANSKDVCIRGVLTTTRARESTAPVSARLPLLPSGPGGVHEVTPREAQPPLWPRHDTTRSQDATAGDSHMPLLSLVLALQLQSTTFTADATMPASTVCKRLGGKNISPELHWSG